MRNHWTRFIVLSLVILLLLGLFWFSRSFLSDRAANVEIRAALDIGSGATNLKVAKVDLNTDKIISQIFEQSILVPYQKYLEQSPNNTFDQEVMDQGIKAIQTLKEVADGYKAKKVVAIATAAFRKADNAKEFAQEVERTTGVRVRIIDQDEEGILAFRGALAITPVEADKAIVWDIGGGSMQLTTLTNEGTYFVEKGKTASIPFKNAIIENIEHKDLKATASPNPMNENTIREALLYAGQLSQLTDPYIQEKIKLPTTQILAVGSLFNYGILPLVDEKKATQDNLEKAIMKMANKTDQELSGLAEVAVSNPVLVLGYMKGLEIPKVTILSINNADGALTYPAYWE